MAVLASGKIEAYVGPPGLGTADDLEAVIVDFIVCACSKSSIAVQELDSEAIARAILASSWRGVHVESSWNGTTPANEPQAREGNGCPDPACS